MMALRGMVRVGDTCRRVVGTVVSSGDKVLGRGGGSIGEGRRKYWGGEEEVLGRGGRGSLIELDDSQIELWVEVFVVDV